MKLVKGVRPGPLRTVLYGQEKVGKTTWAADAPGVAFLCAEDGQRYHDVARIPWSGASAANPLGRPSWDSVPQILQLVGQGVGELAQVQTIVIDTIDALEGLACAHVAGEKALEDVGGGYGKGAKRVAELWRGLLADLDAMQARRPVNVILLAHCKRETQKNPGGVEWQRWAPSLMEGVSKLTTAWADEILFASIEVQKADSKKSTPGLATGRRTVRTVTGPGWVAGNRCGLPDPIPLSFSVFAEKRAAALRGEVDRQLVAEAHDAEQLLDEGKRHDAQGRRLVEIAVAGGPSRVRRFIAWAQEQSDAAIAAAQGVEHAPLADALQVEGPAPEGPPTGDAPSSSSPAPSPPSATASSSPSGGTTSSPSAPPSSPSAAGGSSPTPPAPAAAPSSGATAPGAPSPSASAAASSSSAGGPPARSPAPPAQAAKPVPMKRPAPAQAGRPS